MPKPLRLLIIEDVEDHALLIVRELRKGGLEPQFQRIETLQELEAALDAGPWDAIISDFNLPGFDGISVLQMVQQKNLDLPFLLVSGAIGEEKAAEVMKAGAHDYIRKGNYARLVPTLERELREAKIRQERRLTAEELSRHREHLEELVQERTAELVQVNEALQAEKQEREQLLLQLEAILESIKEGVVISDLDGNVLMMNREALALYECRTDEEVRRPVCEYAELYELHELSGEPVPMEQWPLQRAVRGERFADKDLVLLRKDTGKSTVVSYSGTPVYNKAGEPILAVITVHDITERKRAEQALLLAKEEWERTFNSVPDLIAVLDEQYRIVRVNRALAERLGRQPEECVGLCCHATLHGMESPPGDCPHAKTLADGGSHAAELYEQHLGGHFLVSTSPLLGPDGKTIGAVHVARDISERKRAEEEIERLNAALAARISELEETNEDLEAFNRIVSHDLRQPLNAMGLSCQELELLCGDHLDEECSRPLETALKGVQRMNAMIEALLKFSRSSQEGIRRETIDLSAMATSVMEQLRVAEPQRRVVFNCLDGVLIEGDPVLLRSVMENLLGNAWKYTAGREEAVIDFGTSPLAGEVVCFVRDNGIGFEMAEAEHIFTPFKRLDGVQQQFAGFGIGLATVQRIIRRHGGRIWAEGEPGQGAAFYFMVPAAQGAKEGSIEPA